jgi:succinate dehydrogenase / fumarate reductase iron-sulfur subunit
MMFENLKKVKTWIPIDGTYSSGPGPKMAERDRSWAYELSRCMSCGSCLEACPKYNDLSDFMGASIIAQVRLFNMHPTGEMNKEERGSTSLRDPFHCGARRSGAENQ